MNLSEELQIVLIIGATNVALCFCQWWLEKYKDKIDPNTYSKTSACVQFLLTLLSWLTASRSKK